MSTPRKGRHGESDKDARYVQFHHWMMRSEAWQSLNGNDRSIYMEIAARYRGPGTNNGYIPYSVREAAKSLNIGKSTAAVCLARLEDRGFIVCMQKGVFKASRHATEWRLTEHGCDRSGELATKAFMSWPLKKQKPVPVAGLDGTCGGTVLYLSRCTRQRCRAPAVNGWNVCRLHGAGGGAPCGKLHGNYRHGLRTKQAIAERRSLAELRRLVRETLAEPWFR